MDQTAGAIYEKYSELVRHRLPYVQARCGTTCQHTGTDYKSDRAAIGRGIVTQLWWRG